MGPGPEQSSRYYWRMMGKKMRFSNRHIIFKTHAAQGRRGAARRLPGRSAGPLRHGEQRGRQILALREEIGEFGERGYAGMDWVDPVLAKRSMELMRRSHATGQQGNRERGTRCAAQ